DSAIEIVPASEFHMILAVSGRRGQLLGSPNAQACHQAVTCPVTCPFTLPHHLADTWPILGPSAGHPPRPRIPRAQELPPAVGATLELDLALREPLWPDQDLPGHPDQVGSGELRPRPLVGVVIEHVDALGRKSPIELTAGRVGVAAALLEVEDGNPERRDRLRPLDAGFIVEGLEDRADEARSANSIGTAMDRPLDAIGAGHSRLHWHGIFGAEIENLPDLNAARMHALFGRHLPLEASGIVHIAGCSIVAGPGLDQRGKVAVIVDILARDRQGEHVLFAENGGVAGLPPDD